METPPAKVKNPEFVPPRVGVGDTVRWIGKETALPAVVQCVGVNTLTLIVYDTVSINGVRQSPKWNVRHVDDPHVHNTIEAKQVAQNGTWELTTRDKIIDDLFSKLEEKVGQKRGPGRPKKNDA